MIHVHSLFEVIIKVQNIDLSEIVNNNI